MAFRVLEVLVLLVIAVQNTRAITVPQTAPSNASTVDPSLLSVSIEFFAFPGYTDLSATSTCLANIASLRGAHPAVRIGGTTQCVRPPVRIPIVADLSTGMKHRDRATYDPNLPTAVNYSVASPADAPASLTYGPSFFDLAADLSGDVTIGFNRQLNDISNVGAAATEAQDTMSNLYAIELGNEPDCKHSSLLFSPLFFHEGRRRSDLSHDMDSIRQWVAYHTLVWRLDSNHRWSISKGMGNGLGSFSAYTISLHPHALALPVSLLKQVGNIFQAAVYISFPTWSTQGLIPILGSAIDFVKTFSIHSYPQSACGGASTDLNSLMSHS